MRAYKSARDGENKKEIKVSEALQSIKAFNKEFCEDKSDATLIKEMQISPVYTTLSRYWIDAAEDKS